jgi:hypothetical protein
LNFAIGGSARVFPNAAASMTIDCPEAASVPHAHAMRISCSAAPDGAFGSECAPAHGQATPFRRLCV